MEKFELKNISSAILTNRGAVLLGSVASCGVHGLFYFHQEGLEEGSEFNAYCNK